MEIENEGLAQWSLSPSEAIQYQKHLSSLVVKEANLSRVSTVAGVDASYKGGKARAAIVVLSYPTLDLVDQSTAELPISFPYVPGLLAFREGPAVIEAFKKLNLEPNLIIFDSQGLAHPRKLGLASHLGLILNKPSIGCAKSRLFGEVRDNLPLTKGSFVYLYDRNEIIGAMVRSKEGADPLYVSIGHKIDLRSAISFVLSCVEAGERLPKTTLVAHRLAGEGQLISNQQVMPF